MVAAAEAGALHRAGATFGDLCEEWFTHARSYLAPNTLAETRPILDTALLSRLGGVPLAGLRAEHLDGVYAELLRGGRRDGRPMSPATVQRVHGVARRALSVGVRWGWLAANPALNAMPPQSMRRPVVPPTPQNVARLIAAAEPDLATFVLLAATLGARRGELCGLRWDDIDLDARHVDIVRAIVIVDGHCVEAPTKTRQARRVALDSVTGEALDHRRHRADGAAQRAGEALGPDAFVFSHEPDGRQPWWPDSTSRAFRRLCQEVGLDHVRLHDLRHFVATRLLASGVDVRTVSGRLGHSLTSTTLNVYGAFVPDADRRAAEVMGRLIGGDTEAA